MISLSIVHTPWRPERVESLSRLRAGLGEWSSGPAQIIDERAANHVWALKQWTGAVDMGAEWSLFLQDDVIPAPNFQRCLAAMLKAVPNEVIGLEVIHPAAERLAAEGHRWFTTSDCLVGVGYVLPTGLLREFLAWRASSLKPGAIRDAAPGETQAVNEDTLIALWCLATGRKIWHPVPTLIDHDVSLESSYGNDAHAGRRPAVRWDNFDVAADLLESEDFWCGTPRDAIPHLGRMPGWTVHDLAARVVEGFGADAYARAASDDGAVVTRRLALARKLREPPPKHRLYLATPTRGGVAPEYVTSVGRLLAASEGALFLDTEAELRTVILESADVVRKRSVMVRNFLATSCTHLLFVDDDVSFTPEAIFGMLAAKKNVIACPYPKRDGVNWPAVTLPNREEPPEARAYGYAVTLLAEGLAVADNVAEVAGVGLGCALIERSVLERMVEHYAEDLTFIDGGLSTVALFALIIRNGNMLSEDYSFCRRWRDMGGAVHLYLGTGSPVDHHGVHAYRGHVEAFGLRRRVQR